MKTLLDKLLASLGYQRRTRSHHFELSEELHLALVERAAFEGRPLEVVQAELLAEGLAHRQLSEGPIQRWKALSQREQDVTALACLGYTNKEMGVRLHISAETAKTHLHNVMNKLDVHSKTELRLLLVSWDFSAWGAPRS
jgi:DNA-binding NarL/FixJ family response regulator